MLKVIIMKEDVEKRIKSMAEEINICYHNQNLVVVCILKGAFMFFSDLVKQLDCLPEIDFVRLASYGNENSSSKNIKFTKDIEIDIKDKHVLIVEDILDTGRTIEFLLAEFADRGAASIRTAVLVDKLERRELAVQADFVGFVLDSGFLVGYGLDYSEKYRELPAIYELIFE